MAWCPHDWFAVGCIAAEVVLDPRSCEAVRVPREEVQLEVTLFRPHHHHSGVLKLGASGPCC